MAEGGAAARSIVQAYRVLSAALRDGVRLGVLALNPASAVRPPRPARPALEVPSWATVTQLLEAAQGTPLHVPLVLLATSGARRGEVLALRWREVELDAGLIRITRTAQNVGQVVTFSGPKTDRARRTVDLPASTVAVLRQHRRQQAERRLLAGEAWRDNGLVVDNGLGGPVHPDVLSRSFHRLTERLGIRCRLHDLRHAHATELLRAGINVKVVSERLGHASSSFTLDTYAAVLPGMGRIAADAIERAMGNGSG
jgi:integrase